MSEVVPKPKVMIEDWGMVSYADAWERQRHIHREMMELKLQYRDNMAELITHQVSRLVFCEHPHVYTLGKSGSEDHLRLDEEALAQIGAEFFKINRGGDITYHGPGQVVGYFLFDLDCFRPDVHWFIRSIEEGIIRMLQEYQITGIRLPSFTGVWTDLPQGRYAKVCAIGVHLSRWISMHGFALNVATEMSYFDHIIPCGIQDSNKEVISMEKLTGGDVNRDIVISRLHDIFGKVFGFN